MQDKENLYKISKTDKILSVLMILIAGAAILFSGLSAKNKADPRVFAMVYEDGVVLHRIDLNRDQEILLSDNKGRILVKEGRVCIEHAGCPRRFCVNTGWIQYSGQTIVCLPNRIVIAIESEKAPLLDAVCY